MQPHQQRVVDELKELEDKLEKLHRFTCSPNFDEIVGDSGEASRLVKQKHIMGIYVDILKERIDNFN